MLEQAAPFFVRGRSAKTFEVIGERLPLDKEKVPSGRLQAPLEPEGPPPGRGHEEWFGLFEGRLLPRPDVGKDLFERRRPSLGSAANDAGACTYHELSQELLEHTVPAGGRAPVVRNPSTQFRTHVLEK